MLTDGGTAYVRAGVAPHGIRCVRIVHGKGYGSQGLEPVLKDKARTWLVQKADVLAFSEAPERGGGAGALLVLLRQAEAGGRP
ncbi:Smr domain [Bordetella pertussis]|nr:Smr domain [Bordetella pertussis]